MNEPTTEPRPAGEAERKQARETLVGETPLTVRHFERALGRLGIQERVDEDGDVPATELVATLRQVVREDVGG